MHLGCAAHVLNSRVRCGQGDISGQGSWEQLLSRGSFSLSVLTSQEVFQCHSSGFGLTQQNSKALGVKHVSALIH